MSGGGEVFDPGLQPERTALSWRRTLLALVVVAAVGERLLAPVLGRGALVMAGAGLLAVVALQVLSTRRARSVGESLRERGDLSLAVGAELLAVTAVAACAVGVLTVALLVLRALPG